MKIIGLTGGIGTGKSTVSSYLLSLGYAIIDADDIARQLVIRGSEALETIVSVFGEDIILPDGNLNRPKLATIIFSSAEKRHVLDDIMHPRITDSILKRLKHYKNSRSLKNRKSTVNMKSLIFIDAALLYESGLVNCVDEVWLVDAEESLIIDRLKIRDHITKDEVIKRLQSQLSRDVKISRSDKIIHNSGPKEQLYSQIDELLKENS